MGVHLLGGLSGAELVTYVFGGAFFVLALATPYFGVRQVQEDADSYAHHLVLSGGFVLVLLALATFSTCSFGMVVLPVIPNLVWFGMAHTAQRRAQQKQGSAERPD